MKTPPNIVLVGFMGSGKTSVSHHLARRTGFRQVEMDAEIERREGRSIPEIFRISGEARFRALERELTEEIARGTSQIVSTGGGTWMDPGNRALLSASGWCVWLKVSADEAWRRVGGRIAERPLLAAAPDAKARLRELLESRTPLYELAPVHVETDGLGPEAVAEAVLRRWSEERPFDLPEL